MLSEALPGVETVAREVFQFLLDEDATLKRLRANARWSNSGWPVAMNCETASSDAI
jgi:hypothetical protein